MRPVKFVKTSGALIVGFVESERGDHIILHDPRIIVMDNDVHSVSLVPLVGGTNTVKINTIDYQYPALDETFLAFYAEEVSDAPPAEETPAA